MKYFEHDNDYVAVLAVEQSTYDKVTFSGQSQFGNRYLALNEYDPLDYPVSIRKNMAKALENGAELLYLQVRGKKFNKSNPDLRNTGNGDFIYYIQDGKVVL